MSNLFRFSSLVLARRQPSLILHVHPDLPGTVFLGYPGFYVFTLQQNMCLCCFRSPSAAISYNKYVRVYGDVTFFPLPSTVRWWTLLFVLSSSIRFRDSDPGLHIHTRQPPRLRWMPSFLSRGRVVHSAFPCSRRLASRRSARFMKLANRTPVDGKKQKYWPRLDLILCLLNNRKRMRSKPNLTGCLVLSNTSEWLSYFPVSHS